MKNVDDMKELLTEGQAVYEIVCMTSSPIYIIGAYVEDIGCELDLSGCIESTLHTMIAAGWTADDIYSCLRAGLCTITDVEDDSFYYIDLDYGIQDFTPMHVLYTSIIYEPEMISYTVRYYDKVLCSHFELTKDATDDEVLEQLEWKFGINPDDFIVNDIRDDGTMLSVQHILDGSMLVLLANQNAA